ncbi:MAG TPA: FG-GAP-like repeat-containing protein [Bryobacteraceae bacterium]|nr:FG-GAP-like repeat-containing protein [Bryobacteraceae bacterium]
MQCFSWPPSISKSSTSLRVFVLSGFLLSSPALAQVPSFAAPVSLKAQQASLAVATADFNKDGFPDLAIANAQSNTVSIFLGNGKGQFSAAPVVNLPAACQAAYLTTGNFTGAASPDILAICPLGNIVVLPNTDKGTFGAPVSTSAPEGAWVGNLLLGSIHPAIADFNGDGKLDIALPGFDPNSFSTTCYILAGNGNGSFQPGRPLPLNGQIAVSIATGDFNGDKKADLVTAQYDTSGNFSLQVAAGNGDGTFSVLGTYPLPQTAGSILLVGDVNGDGKLDVVIAGSALDENLSSLVDAFAGDGATNPLGSAGVTVMLGDGTGKFASAFNTAESSYVSGAALADVMGTGKLDLIETVIAGNFAAGDAPTGAVSVRLGKGDGTFGNPVTLSVPSTTIPTDMAIADFNGDGAIDIALASLPTQAVPINLDGLSGLNGLLGQILSELPIGNADVLINLVVPTPPPPPPPPTFTDTNSASFITGPMARGSIVTAFGSGIAAGTAEPQSLAPPVTLGGVSISIKDSTGATAQAPLFYVSQQQINYQVPDSVAIGMATITIQSGSTDFVATQQIVSVAPGIYASNGMAAGSWIQVTNGTQQVYPLIGSGGLTAIDVSGGQTYLVLYGTGIHNHANPVVANVGSAKITAAYAGAQGYYVGEDQINIQLPASLAGAGVVGVTLTVDGQTSNSVNIQIR